VKREDIRGCRSSKLRRRPWIGVFGERQHSGTFAGTSVNDHVRTADLKLISAGTLLNKVPWTALSDGTDERELREAATRAGDRHRKGKRSCYEQALKHLTRDEALGVHCESTIYKQPNEPTIRPLLRG
jgi:hypothetical protein